MDNNRNKTILMIGCNGEIGKKLYEKIHDKYLIIPCDISKNIYNYENFHIINTEDLQGLDAIIKVYRIDVIINLAGIEATENIPPTITVKKMVNCYFWTTYNILEVMRKHGIPRLVLASSNHVTDTYEKNGYSILGREITGDDYPASKSIYGTLKLAAESLCYNYYVNFNLSCICLRIGTYRSNLEKVSFKKERDSRTKLSTDDMVKIFVAAIESKQGYGIYYAVSKNVDKPWSVAKTEEELKLDL